MSRAEAKKKKQAKGAEVEALYADLNTLSIEEFEKRLDVCNRILAAAPQDKVALHTKAVNLIHLGRHDDAEKVMASAELQTAHPFEYAYLLYRQNKPARARELLASIAPSADTSEGVDHLRAQLDYKEGNFEAAARFYRQAWESCMDESNSEVLCNLLACGSTHCGEQDLKDALRAAHQNPHWESNFNVACILLEQRKWREALVLLKECAAMCEALGQQSGWSAAQLQGELGSIEVQQAHALWGAGDFAASRALLDKVIRNKPSSVQASVVADLNWVALNKGKSVFDVHKKLKHAGSPAIDSKLTPQQRMAVRHHYAILLLRMDKLDACRAACETLTQQYPSSDLGRVMLAAVLCKERKYGKAEELLKAYLKAHPGPVAPLRAQLSLAQIQLDQGQPGAAAQTLAAVQDLELKPSVLFFLIKLLQQTRQLDAAIQTLDTAVERLTALPPSQAPHIFTILAKSAELKLQDKRYQEAAATYEQGLKIDPKNTGLISGLVVALAAFDTDKAEQYLSKLPSPVDAKRLAELLQDRAALEDLPLPKDDTKLKKRKSGSGTEMDEDSPHGKKAKKKKKKMRHPPKIVNGEADPERWLPLRARSYYKAPVKKQKEKTGKKDRKW